MNKTVIATILGCIILLPVFAGNGRNVVSTSLKSAIVFRSGAELQHVARAYLQQGTNELVLDGISNKIDLNSVRITTPGKITILSIEFSTDWLRPETKPAQILKLEDSLQSVNKTLSAVQVQIRTDKELLDLMKANRQLGGTQSGMSVSELAKLVDYYKTKSLELETEIVSYRERETKLLELYKAINLQIKELEQKNSKTSGKLLLQLMNPVAGSYDFTISYITPAAYWNPGYDIRVENTSHPVGITYKAKLVQTTGIDWKDVKLSLSTSKPDPHGTAPLFQSWFLSFIDPVARLEKYMAVNSIPSAMQGRVAGTQLNEVVVSGYGVKVRGSAEQDKEAEPLYVLDGKPITVDEFNRLDPANIKSVEVLKDASATAIYGSRAAGGAIVVTLKQGLGDYITEKDNELNVTYDIDIPYDVPSNGKEQFVTMKEMSMPALYKYYAAPKLDMESYLLAEMAGWESLNLLPGEANIIVEGTYIGKTFIDPRSTQDTLNLTLGQDKRVVVKREKLKDFSSVKFLGSNKKQVFTYEIAVRNNKKEKLNMILKDQFPLSSNKEIEVELLETSGASVNAETGVLTWQPELASGETKKYRVSYSVKFPKDKSVNLN